MSLGESHSAAIKFDDSLWMWGRNWYGELGDGKGGDHEKIETSPVKILDDVSSVSLGGSHSAAIKKDGSLWLWVSNSYGQVGNGKSPEDYPTIGTPTKIMEGNGTVSPEPEKEEEFPSPTQTPSPTPSPTPTPAPTPTAKKTQPMTVKAKTFKVKVTVTAAGNAQYNAGSKTVDVSVKVK